MILEDAYSYLYVLYIHHTKQRVIKIKCAVNKSINFFVCSAKMVMILANQLSKYFKQWIFEDPEDLGSILWISHILIKKQFVCCIFLCKFLLFNLSGKYTSFFLVHDQKQNEQLKETYVSFEGEGTNIWWTNCLFPPFCPPPLPLIKTLPLLLWNCWVW